MRLQLDKLPRSLESQRDAIAECLRAMDRAVPLLAVYLFGSHARGEARPDSDVDLCVVADQAREQLETAAKLRLAMRSVWPRPSFTLVPICSERLAEKQSAGDHFFSTVLKEGILIAA